ncbi:hypothetical protein Tco_0783917, partial [Tanacetum coccineum]
LTSALHERSNGRNSLPHMDKDLTELKLKETVEDILVFLAGQGVIDAVVQLITEEAQTVAHLHWEPWRLKKGLKHKSRQCFEMLEKIENDLQGEQGSIKATE